MSPKIGYKLIKEMQDKQQQLLPAFLKHHQAHLSQQVRSTAPQLISARILTEEDVEEAAQSIRNGDLVAFPTETVYGLGANALNPEALKRIYATKKRPLTDPIIVHVLDSGQAEKLVEMSPKQKVVFDLLTKKYWPGPLTIILKANLNILPVIVTAQTGFVGIRAPKHPFARKLIEASQLPIGAPSANLFSHVSPTEAVHVFNDFFNCDISIVDGQRCEFGVESTVIKLLEDEINVLREGSLSIKKLQLFLKQNMAENELPAVMIQSKVIGKGVNMEAPGQLLKHYAPYLPCYFFSGHQITPKFVHKTSQLQLSTPQSAFISFDPQTYSKYSPNFKYYFQAGSYLPNHKQQTLQPQEQDLFCSKQQKSKMRQIYHLLRHCQNLPVKSIIVGWTDAKEGTLWDKIFRSTQGQQVGTIN